MLLLDVKYPAIVGDSESQERGHFGPHASNLAAKVAVRWVQERRSKIHPPMTPIEGKEKSERKVGEEDEGKKRRR